MRRYPVQFELSASYQQYMGLLDTFQQAGQALSVEITKLEVDDDPVKPGSLRGVITFVGFDLGKAREKRKPGRGSYRRR